MVRRAIIAATLALVLAAPHGAGRVRAASVEAAQGELIARLAGEVHLRIALGDGRAAARALTTLAAVDDGSAKTAQAGIAVLDIYETIPAAGEVRAALISRDREARRTALKRLADILAPMTGEYRLPDTFTGSKILGAAEGCPVDRARAFTQGPDGVVHMLSGGLVSYDGRRWQVMDREAIRAARPLAALFADSKGRLWIGGGRAGVHVDGALKESDRPGRGTVAFRQGGPGGRWRTFVPRRRVATFAENKAGVWIATPSLLSVYDGRRMRTVNCPLPYSPSRRLVASPKSDALWVVDVARVSRFDGARWTSYATGKLRTVGGVVLDGKPVIVARRGLVLFGDGRSEMVTFPPGHGTIAAAAAGPNGTVWCVSSQSRLFRTDMKTWGLYRSIARNEFPRQAMPAIFCDGAGRVWLSRGRGLEVHAVGGKPAATVQAERKQIELPAAPLISAAGSGGWTNWGTSVEIARPKNEDEGGDGAASESADDLAAFEEDDAEEGDTPQATFSKLQKSPRSGSAYNRLMTALAGRPNPKLRRQAFALAVKERNTGFYGNGRHVLEFVEMLIDEGRPVQACMLALEAAVNGRRAPVGGTDVALGEALVAMGFGEFARPAFFAIDAKLWMPRRRRDPREFRSSDRTFEPGVRAVTLNMQADVGREALRKAGLHMAVILADKRAVLGSLGDFARWRKLVSDCVAAGDVDAANKFKRLTKDMFDWPKEDVKVDKPASADSVALSPFLWARRIKIAADSGFGLVTGNDGAVYTLNQDDRRLGAIDALTGAVLKLERPTSAVALTADATIRAVIPSGDGVVIILRYGPDRLAAVRVSARKKNSGGVGIDGLTDAFDGFSATRAKGGVFFCYDNGLTKVDLKAGKVVWRNGDLTGGSYPWRSLLERALPVADGEDVFVASGGKLACIDAASGKPRWQIRCDWSGTPAVVGGVVVAGAGPRDVWGLDRKTGARIWRHVGRGQAQAQPVSDGASVFFVTADGAVVALDAKSGRLLWRRPADLNIRPVYGPSLLRTALIARRGRLAACNSSGYIEFDAASGAVLRRLAVATARPMAATKDAVVVMTDPKRLVAVADEKPSDLADKVLALTSAAPKPRAAGMARLVAGYIRPVATKAHEAVLRLSSGSAEPEREALYALMVASVDPFASDSRKLMRDHLELARPGSGLRFWRVLEIVAEAHLERGAVREAAAAFERVTKRRATAGALIEQLRLELAAGDEEKWERTVRRIVAMKPEGALWAFLTLESARREEEALKLVAAQRYDKDDSLQLLYAAVSLSGMTGLLDETEPALASAERLIGAVRRGRLLAQMLSSAGVADRALRKGRSDLKDRVAAYRKLLTERREALKALDRPGELKIVEEQMRRLEKTLFP